ncbi:serine/threonine-protein kinase [Gracilibacillus halotolerans]|uniref:Serine/threonine-protein kinase n=1 Tax=Gracilibacillus halotolerans TaxID=74386 RepID=A0A841RRJ9_9BACI|nr:protein kinase [Gracilibacillus halotolerans]MBB6513976.1 serine/threonine-protein kinase [Gracilibacillus halotolerans]
MMTQASKKLEIKFRRGQIIQGKWHKKSYQIIRELGSGAVGTVYLCVSDGRKVALKVSSQMSSISSEVNVLKSFQSVQGKRLGPSLIDVDDFVSKDGHAYPFYVMEYVEGVSLHEFIQRNGKEWLFSLLVGLTRDLEELHQKGYVFGDLKMENLLVTRNPIRLRWVDVGGTTLQGRAIKEYTEFYDRAYWECGDRKAEPRYDLFALAMVVLRIFYPSGFEKTSSPARLLHQKANTAIKNDALRKLVLYLIQGKMSTASEVRTYLLDAYQKSHDSGGVAHTGQVSRQRQNSQQGEIYPITEASIIFFSSGLFFVWLFLL